MCLVAVKAYGNNPKTLTENRRINTVVIMGTHVIELGLVCWNIVLIIVWLKVKNEKPIRVGSHFVEFEKKVMILPLT